MLYHPGVRGACLRESGLAIGGMRRAAGCWSGRGNAGSPAVPMRNGTTGRSVGKRDDHKA